MVNTKEMVKLREDGEHIGGLRIPDEKAIYLEETCVDYETIKHELFHAYASELHLGSTNQISLDDLEEIFADMFAAKGEKIIRQAKRILKDLTRED